MIIKYNEAWFYQGPYVPSGVIYGDPEWPTYSHMFVPGFNPDSYFINIYEGK